MIRHQQHLKGQGCLCPQRLCIPVEGWESSLDRRVLTTGEGTKVPSFSAPTKKETKMRAYKVCDCGVQMPPIDDDGDRYYYDLVCGGCRDRLEKLVVDLDRDQCVALLGITNKRIEYLDAMSSMKWSNQ